MICIVNILSIYTNFLSQTDEFCHIPLTYFLIKCNFNPNSIPIVPNFPFYLNLKPCKIKDKFSFKILDLNKKKLKTIEM